MVEEGELAGQVGLEPEHGFRRGSAERRVPSFELRAHLLQFARAVRRQPFGPKLAKGGRSGLAADRALIEHVGPGDDLALQTGRAQHGESMITIRDVQHAGRVQRAHPAREPPR